MDPATTFTKSYSNKCTYNTDTDLTHFSLPLGDLTRPTGIPVAVLSMLCIVCFYLHIVITSQY